MKRCHFLSLLYCLCAASSSHATISISQVPLFVSLNNQIPNIVITFDNSGSMGFGIVPDAKISGSYLAPCAVNSGGSYQLYKNCYTAITRFSAASWNSLAYNPKTTYTIPKRSDGISYSTSFSAAYLNGYQAWSPMNLSTNFMEIYSCDASGCYTFANRTNPGAAFYTMYYQDAARTKPSGCSTDSRETEACYVKITVGSTYDLTAGSISEQKQNFANWFSFYRSRQLILTAAALNVVSAIPANQIRLSWQSINPVTYPGVSHSCTSFTSCTTTWSGTPTSYENYMRPLDATKTNSTISHRSEFYNWVTQLPVYDQTPLLSALWRAGEYYRQSGINSPYADDPYHTLGTESSCRKNFHLLFTDGMWSDKADIGNIDNTARSLPDLTDYNPAPPYRDSNSNSMADLAFYYWATDLRPDLANNLSPAINNRSGNATAQYWDAQNNPATWQHMSNYLVSIGLSNAIASNPSWGGSTYSGDYPKLVSGTVTWPATAPYADGNVADLWHAAINSRGQFFNADSYASLSAVLNSALDAILNATLSTAAIAANSTSTLTNTVVYQASFDSATWSGRLLAYNLSSSGVLNSSLWDASSLIPDISTRKMYSWNGTNAGITFDTCTSLSTQQRLWLNTSPTGDIDNYCPQRLAWLRGDATQEKGKGGLLRNRVKSVLGDIINSDPIYVGTEDYGHAYNASFSSTEQSAYKTFLTGKATRTPMLYVGANDGMLHGFDAKTGKEVLAYVPYGVGGILSYLPDPGYTHRYYVDGSPTSADAYLGGWKSVIVGGLGAGGKSVYALDVSNPTTFGAQNVLWEYSDSTDLGYTFSQPQVARDKSGTWVAVFGNGYNSSSDKAFLYVVNLGTGQLIKKIATSSSTANGLSTPTLYDSNGDGLMDVAYAGDLQGNLWKFDLSGTSASSWSLGNGGNPVFTARNASDQIQPITAQAAVGGHPYGGVMIYFGTGSYIATTDPDVQHIQSIYAVWDKNLNDPTLSRSQLRAQTIDSLTSYTSTPSTVVRTTSNYAVDWSTQRGWYMDLVISPSNTPTGERIISRPLLKHDRVTFVTMTPDPSNCGGGGTSFLMELSLLTGSRLLVSSFDLNKDNLFNSADTINGIPASGIQLTQGISKTPTWLEDKNFSAAIKILSGTRGNISTISNRRSAGGRFWRQFR